MSRRLRESSRSVRLRPLATTIATLVATCIATVPAAASDTGPHVPLGPPVEVGRALPVMQAAAQTPSATCTPHPDVTAPPTEDVPAALGKLVDDQLAAMRGVGIGFSLWVDGYGEIADQMASLRMRPASNQKILTAMGALDILGPQTRLVTRVRIDGPVIDGVVQGNLYLVGGGDPTVASTGEHSLDTLASSVAAAGISAVDGSVIADESRYDRIRRIGGWPEFSIPTYVGSLSALVVDQNRYRADWSYIAEPALGNGELFAAALADAGVVVNRRTRTGTAPDAAIQITSIVSPTVKAIVGDVLGKSNNTYAELLVKEVGFVSTGLGATQAGLRSIADMVDRLCVDGATIQHDGSGLSYYDARAAYDWRTLLQAAQSSEWWDVFEAALPVAGVSGSLQYRFGESAAAGNLRAKTGTLDGLRSLSGMMTTAGGRDVFFSIVIDDDDPWPQMLEMDVLMGEIAAWEG